MKSVVVSKLTSLIHDEAIKQLAENYHELLPKMIKIDVDHIEEDLSYAVGAVYFLISGRIVFTPIIYRDGAVDSISYIGDTENETLYGLTKKMYKRIISSTKLEFGKPLDKNEESRLLIDKGIIGRLFATPQTMSPKVANDENYHENVIIDMFNDPHFAKSFEKLASMDGYKEVLHDIYSDRVFNALTKKTMMSKIASIVTEDDGSQTYNKIADLAALPPRMRAEAARSIARNGFYKVASDNSTKAAVFEVPKIGDVLMKTKTQFEILTEPGIYNALKKDMSLMPVIVARDGDTNKNRLYTGYEQTLVHDASQHQQSKTDMGPFVAEYNRYREIIGLPAGAINDDPRMHIASVFGKETSPSHADMIILMYSKDDLYVYNIHNVTKVGTTLVVKVEGFGGEEKLINVSEKHGFVKSDGAIYIHPNHVMFVSNKRVKHQSLTSRWPNSLSTLMSTSDMNAAIVKTASHTISYSAGAYLYNGERLPRADAIQRLRSEGFDEDSVHDIIKTAADSAGAPVDFSEISQTLKAILAEITESRHSLAELKEMIMQGAQNEQAQAGGDAGGQPAEQAEGGAAQDAGPQAAGAVQQIMDLAASVGADGQAILKAGKAQGMDEAQIVQKLQQEIQEMQDAQGGAQPAGGEQPQGSAMEQDQAAAQAQDPGMAQAQDPGMAQAQDPGMAQGQDPGMAQGQAQDPTIAAAGALKQQGYNTAMTPEMLEQLQQIADKDVLNASIISYLIDTQDAKAVTAQYIEDIIRGVNGLARTLLLVEVQRTNFVDQVGDKQLNAFLSRGKTLLNRMTDFVIDISMIN